MAVEVDFDTCMKQWCVAELLNTENDAAGEAFGEHL
jgi:hypothetical protein